MRGKRFSILPIITLNGIIAHDIIEGLVTTEKFVNFLHELMVLSQFNIPCVFTSNLEFRFPSPIPPRSCGGLILDNCRIHHTEEIRQLVKDEAHTWTFHIFIHVHIFMLTMLQYASLFSCLYTHPTTILLSKLFHQSKLSWDGIGRISPWV